MRVPVAVMAGLPANCYTLLYFYFVLCTFLLYFYFLSTICCTFAHNFFPVVTPREGVAGSGPPPPSLLTPLAFVSAVRPHLPYWRHWRLCHVSMVCSVFDFVISMRLCFSLLHAKLLHFRFILCLLCVPMSVLAFWQWWALVNWKKVATKCLT